jgi:Icc-related predicted phosphoesterase
MTLCLFASDLHGRIDRYEKLFAAILERNPSAVFLGGDLLPFPLQAFDIREHLPADFAHDYLAVRFEELRWRMGKRYPITFVILGNDDPRSNEPAMVEGDAKGLWQYCHERKCDFDSYMVFGRPRRFSSRIGSDTTYRATSHLAASHLRKVGAAWRWTRAPSGTQP